MKTLKERNCHMHYVWNNVLEAWNCCLVKSDGTEGCIKVFVYNQKHEGLAAATKWANLNYRSLRNSGDGGVIYEENE